MTSLRALLCSFLAAPLAASVGCGLIEQDGVDGPSGSTATRGGEAGGAPGSGGESDGGVSLGGASDGGTPGLAGAPSSGGACTTDDLDLFDCPDVCTALAELNCDVHRHRAIYHLRGGEGAPVVAYYVLGGYMDCYYDEGDLVGAALNTFNHYDYCDGSSKSLVWGREPPPLDDTAVAPLGCTAMGLGGSSGDPDPAAQCYSTRWNQCGTCCPETPPDCTNEPDQAFECNTPTCDCHCLGGQWGCDC